MYGVFAMIKCSQPFNTPNSYKLLVKNHLTEYVYELSRDIVVET